MKYSIRKLSVGVFSLAIGATLVGVAQPTVQAAEVTSTSTSEGTTQSTEKTTAETVEKTVTVNTATLQKYSQQLEDKIASGAFDNKTDQSLATLKSQLATAKEVMTTAKTQAEVDVAYQQLVIASSGLRTKSSEEKSDKTTKDGTTNGKETVGIKAENTEPLQRTNSIAASGEQDPRNGNKMAEGESLLADSTAPKAVANEISGTVSGRGTSSAVLNQKVDITTTTKEAAKAGDYVEYVFDNVATTTLQGVQVKAADGTVIGSVNVIKEAVPEVNKQSSGNEELQKSTDPSIAWQGIIRVVFNNNITAFQDGTTFTFGSNGVSSPVVWSDQAYTLNSKITSTNGTGTITTAIDIPAYPVAAVKPLVGLQGAITFDSNQNYTSNANISIRPQEDVTEGGIIEMTLVGDSGVLFVPDKVNKAALETKFTRELLKNSETGEAPSVNDKHAYIIPKTPDPVTVQVVEVTPTTIKIKVVKGTIPKLRNLNVTLGTNAVELTRDNFDTDSAGNIFLIPDTTQTINNKEIGENNKFRVQGPFAKGSITYTKFVDQNGTPIREQTLGTHPTQTVDGYRLVSSSKDGVTTTNVYHKLAERTETKTITRTINYIDASTKQAILNSTPVKQEV